MRLPVGRRAFLSGVAGAITVGSAGCSAPRRNTANLDTNPFSVFRGNVERHGYYPDQTVPSDVEVAWSVPGVNVGDHTAAKSSAVPVPGGDVIIPGDSRRVYRISSDGDVRWETKITDASRGIHGTPAIANGLVYLGGYDGVFTALDLETGDIAWQTPLGDAIGSSPAYHDGTVYIAVEYIPPDGSLFGLDAASGTVEWESPRPDDHPHSTTAIDRDSGTMVVGSNDGRCYGWEYPSRSFKWSFNTGEPIKGPIATYDRGAFFGSWDSNFYRLDLADGTVDWTFNARDDIMSGPAIDRGTGTVYVGSHDANLYALDFVTGERKWQVDTGGLVIGCPTVTADHVLVGSYADDGHLTAYNKTTGEQSWRVTQDGWITSTPRVTADGIYYTERATDSDAGAAYKLVDAT